MITQELLEARFWAVASYRIASAKMTIETPSIGWDRSKKRSTNQGGAATIVSFCSGGDLAAARCGSGARLLCSELSASFYCSTFCRIAKTSSF